MSDIQEIQEKKVDNADERVCVCRNVTVRDIRHHMAEPNATVEGLVAKTGIGTKCTACLLNLDVILSSFTAEGRAAGAALKLGQKDWRNVGSGPLTPKDYLDSGFLMEESGLSTEFVCANYGLQFQPTDSVVSHEYSIQLFAEDGRRAGRTTGRLEPNNFIHVRLGEIADCPTRGWFLFRLKPLSFGLEGSIRPQFLIRGQNFAASVHTQPHWTACGGKAVMLTARNSTFSASVAMINAVTQSTRVIFRLSSLNNQKADLQEKEIVLPGLGSALISADELFHAPESNSDFLLSVVSDNPTRKHIVNHLSDGAWSIDHFPNSK
jgi:bacterioferritin-associated ferredoxin